MTGRDDSIDEVVDMHGMAAIYLLGALDPDEHARFEEHLGTCAECHEELIEMSDGVETLARSVAVTAPSGMRAEVMAAIERLTPIATLESRRPVLAGVTAALAVAAVVLAVVLFGVAERLDEQRDVTSVLAAPDATTVQADSTEVGPARLVVSHDTGRAVFIADTLPAVSNDETYQLWLIDAQGTPTSAGLFTTDDGRSTVLFDVRTEPGLTVGLTVEPSGGSETPTGSVVFAAKI